MTVRARPLSCGTLFGRLAVHRARGLVQGRGAAHLRVGGSTDLASTPGSQLGIRGGVRLLGVPQGRAQTAVAEALADGGEADAAVDEGLRVPVAKIVQRGALEAGSPGVGLKPLLRARVGQGACGGSALSAEERACR